MCLIRTVGLLLYPQHHPSVAQQRHSKWQDKDVPKRFIEASQSPVTQNARGIALVPALEDSKKRLIAVLLDSHC